MENEVRLKINSMSAMLRPAEAFALVMEEADGERKMPVIIGALEAQAVRVALSGVPVPRPLTSDLLVHVVSRLGGTVDRVLIYKVRDGIYYSYLILKKGDEDIQIDCRTSDAIAIALRTGAGIFTTEEIISCHQLREEREGVFSINIDMVGVKALEEALDNAVESENYELASKLRDEIERRKQSGMTSAPGIDDELS